MRLTIAIMSIITPSIGLKTPLKSIKEQVGYLRMH